MKKLLILTLCLVAISANAQEKYTVVKEGKGLEGISVGSSTMTDVVKKFGKDYKWTVNRKYSFQMTYAKNNIAFYMCQSDKKKQVFLIEIKAPYKAKTSKGIMIGKSTVADVEKKYGKLKRGLEYRGVSFYYNTVAGKKIVTEIDVTENSGIRQCKVNKK